MQAFIQKIKFLFADKTLRMRLIFTFGALIIFRFLAIIPIPGVNTTELARLVANNQFLGLIDLFSGGGLSTVSIVMLGVGPYISASIILQLLTMIFPKLKEMYQEEGEMGRKKFAQYTRLLTIPLALLSAFGYTLLLVKQGVILPLGTFEMAVNIITIAAGSILLMWIGELITEFGIGNGVSLIIFAGIVAQLPVVLGQLIATFDPSQIPIYLAMLIVGVIIIASVVFITEAERPVPVTYAKRIRGNRVYGGTSSYLPLRLNQAGVIPIIFALSLLLFPTMIFNFLGTLASGWAQAIGNWGTAFLSNQLFYGVAYFLLVVIFTYFYTAVTFDPHGIADNLQKNGAFIPGVRPGQPTTTYLGAIVTRITLVGALFLGIIAVLPLIVQGLTGFTYLAIGGTALLIVVNVVTDLVKKIDAQLSIREY
jgi:preprotein translocase subunit SecY